MPIEKMAFAPFAHGHADAKSETVHEVRFRFPSADVGYWAYCLIWIGEQLQDFCEFDLADFRCD